MPTTQRTVVVVSNDQTTRQCVVDALEDAPVTVVSAFDKGIRHGQRVVGDVAVIDLASVDRTAVTADRVGARQLLVLAEDDAPCAHSVLRKPIDPDAVRMAVARLHKRIAYTDGLTAYAEAAVNGGDTGHLNTLRTRLEGIQQGFDHEDFVDAFREAVGGRPPLEPYSRMSN